MIFQGSFERKCCIDAQGDLRHSRACLLIGRHDISVTKILLLKRDFEILMINTSFDCCQSRSVLRKLVPFVSCTSDDEQEVEF